jgi:hypothetical protein
VKLFFSLALTLFLAVGCVAARRGGPQSFTSEAFAVWSGSAVLEDVVERIYATYPPGRTALFLAGADDFAQALESALRKRGYSLAPEATAGVLSLTWRVDRLADGAWFLIVRLSDGYCFSRVYQNHGQAVTPAAGILQGVF